MRVLLSIKPQYAEKIFSGEKKYEFRRSIFKEPDIKTIVVYASSPVQRIIGEFDVDCVLCATPSKLWKQTKRAAGITEKDFFQYFTGKHTAYAIKLGKVRRYRTAVSLKDKFEVAPPQSFVYIQ